LTPRKLVNEESAKIGLKGECMIGIEADHNAICCLRSDGERLRKITSFIDSATKVVKKCMKKVSEECRLL
jgi:hypothetical protein